MDALLDQTLSAMERECESYAALLALAQEQRLCLIRGAAPRLEQIVEEQSELTHRAAHASRCAQAHLDRLAAALPLPQGWRGADLAQALPPQAAGRYQGLRRRLLSLADDLRRLGRINHQLATGALRYIDFSLRLIGRSADAARPYASDGSPSAARSGNLMVDTRV